MHKEKIAITPCDDGLTNGSSVLVTEGTVFNIQRFTVHDGPGIRTEIFLKGCPLRCKWCGNPEGLKSKIEIGVYPTKCIGIDKCGFCLKACPHCDEGVFFQHNNLISGIDRNICDGCAKCAAVCPANALKVWGEKMTVSQVMETVIADLEFYEKSGGGVTVSGGEALFQWQFVLAIFNKCALENIHTCLETTLHCDPDVLEKIYPFTDMVITDIKHMDGSAHKEYTRVDNRRILENIVTTAEMNKPLVIRIPVIPNHNDSEENIRSTGEFIKYKLQNKVKQVQLLPYRQLGIEKYLSLGRNYPMENFPIPKLDEREKNIHRLAEILQTYSIPAVVGADCKIQ